MNGKIEELQEIITNLSEEKAKMEKELRDEIAALKDEIHGPNNVNLPEGIKVGQWYPERVIEYPSKRRYDDGDTIKLDGMKMEFRRVVEENGHYKGSI